MGRQNSIIGSPLGNHPIPAFYNGKYKVMTFRHYISTTDAWSEFSMVKDALDVGSDVGVTTKQWVDSIFDSLPPSVADELEQQMRNPIESTPPAGRDRLNPGFRNSRRNL